MNHKPTYQGYQRSGLGKTSIHQRWVGMMERCYNPNSKSYKDYGNRGIAVCPEWWRFEKFVVDMLDTFETHLELDRKDNSAGYSKENCHWVTRKTNTHNRRSNVHVVTPQGRMVLQKAARKYGICSTTLAYRIKRGWPKEKWFLPANGGQRICV
jgi:hypothetical protein